MLAILGELCWLEFFKTVYLKTKTSNVRFGLFFQTAVTYETGLISLHFFFFSHTYKSCRKMQRRYLIVLKFGTQTGSIKVHHGMKFGWITIKLIVKELLIISNYSQKNTNMLPLLQGKPLMGIS